MEYEISNPSSLLALLQNSVRPAGGRLGGVGLFSGTIKDGCGCEALGVRWGMRKVPAGSRAVPLAGQKKRPNVISNLNPNAAPQFFAHAKRCRTGRYQIALLAVVITTFNHVCCGVSFTSCPMAVSFRTPSNLQPLPCTSIGHWSQLSLRRAVEANLRVHGR